LKLVRLRKQDHPVAVAEAAILGNFLFRSVQLHAPLTRLFIRIQLVKPQKPAILDIVKRCASSSDIACHDLSIFAIAC
jgi:hypothetical protein